MNKLTESQRMREATDFLYGIPKFTKKNPLEHTVRLMARLGNPQDSFGVIHVAGSNGKGSVCSFLFSILRECGCHTGMFTSPHLIDIRERFMIDGQMVSRADFLDAYEIVLEEAKNMQTEGDSFPTFFEFIFALGCLIFQKSGVKYAILETGMGGRLDATNTVAHPLVCVITSVSLEHTEYLGETIEQIAFEKAGIIKPGVPVVFDGNHEKVAAVIRARAKWLGADSYEIQKNMCKIRETDGSGIDFSFASPYDKKTDLHISFHASYQMMNASLAVTAFRRLEEQESNEDKIRTGIAKAVWPGRMQEVLPDVWLDGAHNPDGIRAFAETAGRLTKEDKKRPLLLFSMVKDKDYRQAAEILLRSLDWELICATGIPSERSLTADVLENVFLSIPETTKTVPVIGMDDYREAFREMLGKKEDGQKLFVTGSLYFIGALLEEIQNAEF